MVTDVEQKQETEESEEVKVTEEIQEPEESETSKETETVSEEEEVITFKTQDELNKFITEKATPIAQGMKDRELKSVYDELQQYKKEKETLQLQLTDKQENTKLSKLEQAELAEYGETNEVKDFQEARRETIIIGRANRDKAKEIEDRASRLNEAERQNSAQLKALKLFLPEDEEFLSKIDTFAKKLAEADTVKEMDLLIRLEELALKGTVQPKEEKVKTKRTRPDSNLSTITSPGASTLKGEAAIKEGLRRERSKQGG